MTALVRSSLFVCFFCLCNHKHDIGRVKDTPYFTRGPGLRVKVLFGGFQAGMCFFVTLYVNICGSLFCLHSYISPSLSRSLSLSLSLLQREIDVWMLSSSFALCRCFLGLLGFLLLLRVEQCKALCHNAIVHEPLHIHTELGTLGGHPAKDCGNAI